MRPDEQQLLEEAMTVFPFGPDIRLELEHERLQTKDSGPDAYAVLSYQDQKLFVAIEVKARPIDRVTILKGVQEQFQKWNHADDGILVTEYLSPALAQRCREMNLQFLDTAGNLYIKQPNLLLWHYGNPKPAHLSKPETPTATSIAIQFLLLAYPELVRANYRDIAEWSGFSLGSVAKVFAMLEKAGYLQPERGLSSRRLINRQNLIDKWLLDYARVLYPKRKLRRYSAITESRIAKPHSDFNPRKFNALWGAESAAARITHYLTPGRHTLYLSGSHTELVKTERLRADPNGTIEIVEPFWHEPIKLLEFDNHGFRECVPMLMVAADLLATDDPRCIETAELIKAKYLRNAFDQAS